MSAASTTGPRNRLTREQRLERWNAANAEGDTLRPKRLTGKRARYDWFDDLFGDATLSSHVRLVGMVTILAGNVDGSNIFPGVRTIADRCALSQRVVSESLDKLVRRGRLKRRWRDGANGAGRGFQYILTVPTVLTQSKQSVLTKSKHQKASVLTRRKHSESVLTHGQHSADAGAFSADADDSSVLTQRQPTIPGPVHIPDSPTESAAPPSSPQEARRAENVVELSREVARAKR
jgi:hypothetical protein